MLLGAASCSSDIEPAMGGEVPVSFAVNLGDNIGLLLWHRKCP